MHVQARDDYRTELNRMNIRIEELQDGIDALGDDPKNQGKKAELARQKNLLVTRRNALLARR